MNRNLLEPGRRPEPDEPEPDEPEPREPHPNQSVWVYEVFGVYGGYMRYMGHMGVYGSIWGNMGYMGVYGSGVLGGIRRLIFGFSDFLASARGGARGARGQTCPQICKFALAT